MIRCWKKILYPHISYPLDWYMALRSQRQCQTEVTYFHPSPFYSLLGRGLPQSQSHSPHRCGQRLWISENSDKLHSDSKFNTSCGLIEKESMRFFWPSNLYLKLGPAQQPAFCLKPVLSVPSDSREPRSSCIDSKSCRIIPRTHCLWYDSPLWKGWAPTTNTASEMWCIPGMLRVPSTQ